MTAGNQGRIILIQKSSRLSNDYAIVYYVTFNKISEVQRFSAHGGIDWRVSPGLWMRNTPLYMSSENSFCFGNALLPTPLCIKWDSKLGVIDFTFSFVSKKIEFHEIEHSNMELTNNSLVTVVTTINNQVQVVTWFKIVTWHDIEVGGVG